MIPNIDIAEAMTIKLDDVLPEMPKFQEGKMHLDTSLKNIINN